MDDFEELDESSMPDIMNALKVKSKSEFNPSAAFSHLGIKKAD